MLDLAADRPEHRRVLRRVRRAQLVHASAVDLQRRSVGWRFRLRRLVSVERLNLNFRDRAVLKIRRNGGEHRAQNRDLPQRVSELAERLIDGEEQQNRKREQTRIHTSRSTQNQRGKRGGPAQDRCEALPHTGPERFASYSTADRIVVAFEPRHVAGYRVVSRDVRGGAHDAAGLFGDLNAMLGHDGSSAPLHGKRVQRGNHEPQHQERDEHPAERRNENPRNQARSKHSRNRCGNGHDDARNCIADLIDLGDQCARRASWPVELLPAQNVGAQSVPHRYT